MICRLFIPIFLIISGNLFSQGPVVFERLNEHKFSDGELVGKLHKFEHVFALDADTHKKFIKFNRARKTQRTLNYVAGGAVALGLAAAISNDENDIMGAVESAGMIAGGLVVGLIAAGIGNGILGPVKNKRKNKLLDGLNQYGYSPELKLGLTVHGAGFVFNF